MVPAIESGVTSSSNYLNYAWVKICHLSLFPKFLKARSNLGSFLFSKTLTFVVCLVQIITDKQLKSVFILTPFSCCTMIPFHVGD